MQGIQKKAVWIILGVAGLLSIGMNVVSLYRSQTDKYRQEGATQAAQSIQDMIKNQGRVSITFPDANGKMTVLNLVPEQTAEPLKVMK